MRTLGILATATSAFFINAANGECQPGKDFDRPPTKWRIPPPIDDYTITYNEVKNPSLDVIGRAELLKKWSPKFIGNSGECQAICDPADYVDGCQILCVAEEKFWWAKPNGDLKWTRAEFIQFLKDNENWGVTIKGKEVEKSAQEWSAHFEIKPRNGMRNNSDNVKRRYDGKGIFGHVQHLGGELYSVKYFLFLAWNETAYSTGEGNHEGDWIGIDLQVRVPVEGGKPNINQSQILYGLYHNHGRILLVQPSMMERMPDGRPIVLMEKGTNEAWPNRGSRGFGGWPDGLQATKDFGRGEGDKSEHKVVREHYGKGIPYDTWGKMVNLETSDADAAWLVMNYRGQWGEEDDDDLQWLTGHDVTNPYSPCWNPKMWDRSFSPGNTQDPAANAGIWHPNPTRPTVIITPNNQRGR
ncbi:MAG: hypothetical protein AB7O99_05935 [Dongiaceae bacterium]